MKRKYIRIAIVIAVFILMMTQAAFAENSAGQEGNGEKSVRTVLLYLCGTDLEAEAGMASFNLRQVLNSNFSDDDDVKFIVMSEGAAEWQLQEVLQDQ